MVAHESSPRARPSRRWAWIAAGLGLFVLLDLSLFGWLIFRSLSQREIERVLLETRQEAENLANRIAGEAEDVDALYTAVALERETQTYIDSVLRRRDVVQTIEVRDRAGALVFRGVTEAVIPERGAVDSPPSVELPPQVERRSVERRSTYDLDVPIGDVGFLHIGINRDEMERRIEVLRQDLVSQTALLAALTAAVLIAAYLVMTRLWRRGRQLEEQAREAERMAYIGTLAAGLAHEIRNPLNSLSLNMQLMEEDLGTRPRLLEITNQELGRLERLVTDFLTYAKPRPLEREVVPAVVVLEECRDLVAAEVAAASCELVLEDRTDGDAVSLDREQGRQLLINLVRNGLGAGAKRIVLAVDRNGADIRLSTRDDGGGIPAEELPKVFELFHSTRRGGTGLGLAVVRRIARDHGGEVRIDSVRDMGTEVTVELPGAARDPLPQSAGGQADTEVARDPDRVAAGS